MSLIDRASEAIRAAGGRMTAQRRLIVELLAASEHLDAEALYQFARRRDPAINLATVYRTLHTLEMVGLIRQQYISPDHERR